MGTPVFVLLLYGVRLRINHLAAGLEVILDFHEELRLFHVETLPFLLPLFLNSFSIYDCNHSRDNPLRTNHSTKRLSRERLVFASMHLELIAAILTSLI